MRLGTKFVAASLLATVLLLPLVTLAMCADAGSGSSHCPKGCPMAKLMSKMRLKHPGEQFSAKRDYSCCNFENAAPTPVTESQIVTPVAIALLSASHVQLLPAKVIERAASGDTSPPPLEPSQARLCTFLI